MLSIIFVICAAGGGVLVLAQVLLSLLGVAMNRGGGHAHVHAHHHVHVHHRAGGHAARSGKMVHRAAAKPAHTANATHQTHAKHGKSAKTHTPGGESWALMWLLGLFNFQGIVAGATVFGLTGLAASAAGWPVSAVLGVAIVAALIMMMLVAVLFSAMMNFDEEGTLRMEEAVGATGTVYLTIPGNHAGLGKVTVKLQQRMMEFAAVTFQEAPLPTGEQAMVVAVHDGGVVEVVSASKYLPDMAQLSA